MKSIRVQALAGKEYGRVPGHRYHEVEVTLERASSGTWTSGVVETWGRNRGRLEEHGRKTVAAWAFTLEKVVCKSLRKVSAAKIQTSYFARAISGAAAEAAHQEGALPKRTRRGYSNSLSRFSPEELLAEIRSLSIIPAAERWVSSVQASATAP